MFPPGLCLLLTPCNSFCLPSQGPGAHGPSVPAASRPTQGCRQGAEHLHMGENTTGVTSRCCSEKLLRHSPSCLFFSISSSTVGVFSLLHLPQPSEGGMLCNGRPRKGKLSHGAGGRGPSPWFAGGAQGRAVSEPGLTVATWPEEPPSKPGLRHSGVPPCSRPRCHSGE